MNEGALLQRAAPMNGRGFVYVMLANKNESWLVHMCHDSFEW